MTGVWVEGLTGFFWAGRVVLGLGWARLGPGFGILVSEFWFGLLVIPPNPFFVLAPFLSFWLAWIISGFCMNRWMMDGGWVLVLDHTHTHTHTHNLGGSG